MTSLKIGSVIYSSVKPIFKIYFIIGSGYLLAKLNILTVEVTRNLSDMIVMLILPCLAFNKIVSSISIGDLKSIGVICLSSTILYTLGAFCALLAIIFTPVPRKWYGGCLSGGMFPNIADLPIAYIQTLDTGLVFTKAQGDKGVAYVCIFLATFLFCQFNIGGFRLVEYDFSDHTKSDLEKEINNNYEAAKKLSKNNNQLSDSESRELTNDVTETKSVETNTTNTNLNKNTSNTATNTALNIANTSNTQNPDTSVPNSVPKNIEEEAKKEVDEEIISEDENPISVVTSLSSSIADDEDRLNSAGQYVQTVKGVDIHEPERIVSRGSTKSDDIRRRNLWQKNNLYPVRSDITKLTTNGSYATGNSLNQTQSRTLELRTLPSQSVKDVISEYSRVNNRPAVNRMSTLTKIFTTELGISTRDDMKNAGNHKSFINKYHLNWLYFTFQNFLRPCSVSLILSLLFSLVPWLKALFVSTSLAKNIPNAPDELPPLSFLIDYTGYIGQASVPLGLLMLGTTLFRLDFSHLNKKFLISSATLVILKLCVVPIVGVGWASKLRSLGWLDDNIIFFVICITYSLPSATTQFYLTASYTDPGAEDTTQIDCLSVYLLMEYALLAISLPFVVTYLIMKQMG